MPGLFQQNNERVLNAQLSRLGRLEGSSCMRKADK
jgi:hypothetical protein